MLAHFDGQIKVLKCAVAGDAFVRELDFSRITLRLKEKQDKKGDSDPEDTVAQLQGRTLDTLQRCLVRRDTQDYLIMNYSDL